MVIRAVGGLARRQYRRLEYRKRHDGEDPHAPRTDVGGNRSGSARNGFDNPEFRALIQQSSASVVVCRDLGRGPFYAGV